MSPDTILLGHSALSNSLGISTKLRRNRLRRYAFALFATFVATLLHFLIHPVIKGVFDLFLVCIFAAVAFLTSLLSVRLTQTNSKLEEAYDDLENRIRQRTEELWQTNVQLKAEVAQRLEAQRAILEISNREQYRLGQDLHDGLIQVLIGTRLIVEELKVKLAAENHPIFSELEIVESSLTDALTQADTVSRGLYPVELEKHGLMAALEELANKTSRVYPVSCLFICHFPFSLDDPAAATHLYRIAQEAVSNAIKGGKAKRINIRFFRRHDHIFLTVADNGIGLKNGPLRNGMGMQIMNYRARIINGDLQFFSRSHGGTLVRCTFRIKNGGIKK